MCYNFVMDTFIYIVLPVSFALIGFFVSIPLAIVLVAAYICFGLAVEMMYKKATGKDCTPDKLPEIIKYLFSKKSSNSN